MMSNNKKKRRKKKKKDVQTPDLNGFAAHKCLKSWTIILPKAIKRKAMGKIVRYKFKGYI